MYKTGCYCNEHSTGEIYDNCVLDRGMRKECLVAARNYRIKVREDCKYWRVDSVDLKAHSILMEEKDGG